MNFSELCEENDYEIVVFHSLRHLSTGYKLKMTNGDVKSVQGDTGHAETEMVQMFIPKSLTRTDVSTHRK